MHSDRFTKIAGLQFAKWSLHEAVNRITGTCREGSEAMNVFPVNVDVLVQSKRDRSFHQVLSKSGLLLIDGMPLVWLARLLRDPVPERVAGSDLVEELSRLGASCGLRFYFLGAAPGVAEEAALQVQKTFGTNVVGCYSPSKSEIQDEQLSLEIVNRVNQSNANILLVAFGAPKQETWIRSYSPLLHTNVNIAVGGTLDFLAGRIPRAPQLVRRMGIEWLYRLLREPRRLWKRYLVRDSRFALIILNELWRFTRGTKRDL